MIVLRPFTFLDSRVGKLLEIAAEQVPGVEVIPIETPVDQVTAYHDAVVAWWDLAPADQDLVIVEQDIAVAPDTLSQFDACDHPVCGFPNNAAGTVLITTGCVKFSPELRAAEPHALRLSRQIGVTQDGLAAGHWARIDVRIFGTLAGMGYVPHQHGPEVAHLRDEPILRQRAMTGRSD